MSSLTNYKLFDTTHTMNIWERIIDRRLREETSSSVSCRAEGQLMPFAVRQLIEKLHMVFIDLEKADK